MTARPTEEQERACHVRIGHRWEQCLYNDMLKCVDCGAYYNPAMGRFEGRPYSASLFAAWVAEKVPCPAQVRR